MWQLGYIVLFYCCILQTRVCLKVPFSLKKVIPLGRQCISAALNSIPRDDFGLLMVLARILSSEFPFIVIRGCVWNSISVLEAKMLYATFINYPEMHDKVFHLARILTEPFLYAEIQKCPELFRPKLYRRGVKVELDTANELSILMKHFPKAYTVQMRRRKYCHFEILLENVWNYYFFKTAKRVSLNYNECILRMIEFGHLQSFGYDKFWLKIEGNRTSAMDSLVYIWETIERGRQGLKRWQNEYDNVVAHLRRACAETSSYWIARLLLATLRHDKVLTIHGCKLGLRLLVEFLDTCDYMNVQPSIMHELLSCAARSKIHLSKEKLLRHDQLFRKLAYLYHDRPYYGADDELALRAWKNRLLFFHSYEDISLGGGIRDLFDFVIFYRRSSRRVRSRIKIGAKLSIPITVGDSKCSTTRCIIKESYKLCVHLLKVILNPQAGPEHFIEQETRHVQRAVIVYLLIWIANTRYRHDSIAMRIIRMILECEPKDFEIRSLQSFIKKTEIDSYLRERICRTPIPKDDPNSILSITDLISTIFT